MVEQHSLPSTNYVFKFRTPDLSWFPEAHTPLPPSAAIVGGNRGITEDGGAGVINKIGTGKFVCPANEHGVTLGPDVEKPTKCATQPEKTPDACAYDYNSADPVNRLPPVTGAKQHGGIFAPMKIGGSVECQALADTKAKCPKMKKKEGTYEYE